jgi:tRNA pseudouridine38-40 synthase
LLAVQDRKEAGITAPPDGLYFINAYYPDEFQLPNVPLGPVWLNIE